jgi:hypothetical protein
MATYMIIFLAIALVVTLSYGTYELTRESK